MGTRPSVFTIPAGVSFVDSLASALLDEYRGNPLGLSQIRILVPTRRATRTLREAFLRASDGRALVLPRMQPIGDVDDDELLLSGYIGDAETGDVPPAIPALERTLLLSQLVMAWRKAQGGDAEPALAFQLAAELSRFLDQMQTEGKQFSELAKLVPEEFAHHWQVTLDFLNIVGEAWPEILKERGYLDPATRRDLLLRRLASQWTQKPPAHPVIAAGSTGSIPATADLIKAIANLPLGRVVLPGLDTALDQESWDALSETHPQFGMKHLLEVIGLDRAEVLPWSSAAPSNPARNMLLTEALRPPETTGKWRDLKIGKTKAMEGLTRIDAPTQQEEAGSIALILREVLETKGKTASLITPDRRLARRVAAALQRWDIDIDDSGGMPLARTPVATFLQLLMEMVADDFAPVALLAALKHPLCRVGTEAGAFRHQIRALEREVLRGPRPAQGLDGLTRALAESDQKELVDWWREFASQISDLVALFGTPSASLSDVIAAHVILAETLATTESETGDVRLWQGNEGEAMAGFLENMGRTAQALTPIDPRHYPALLETAMSGEVVRPQYGRHPRLAILGPLEARLHHADVVILGGLNEGSWPPDTGTDPWMSRPMKSSFGLPLPERRVGLSAHDFVQASAAPVVYLTRAEKVDGEPTIPSRWLQRLDALIDEERWPASPHLSWHQGLDAVDTPTPCVPPAPCPPVDARPRQLSVTQIETWMRDPYALYAAKVLALSPLDPLDADPGAAERGSFSHKALQLFTERFSGELADDAVAQLIACGEEALGGLIDRPQIRAFWWPRFEQIADWFVAQQRDRMDAATPVAAERDGRLSLDNLPGRPFLVTARADRIDQHAEGGYEIIDYKTGGAPTNLQLLAGYGAQMPLEAAILEAGDFEGIPAARVTELSWWLLKGDESKNSIDAVSRRKRLEKTVAELAAEAREGLRQVVIAFDDPKTPYVSLPNPMERGYGDYDHLARIKEWGL